MLIIKDAHDLKKYLETRRAMVQRQLDTSPIGSKSSHHCIGVIYGFEEAMKAVDALLQVIDAAKPD